MIKIALINKSSVVTDAEVQKAAPALNQQMRTHFYNAWYIVCGVYYKKSLPASGYWPVYILDESDQPGALGYHEFTTAPQAKVFAKTCKDDGVSWTSCASHEILEMAVDPLGVLAALDETSATFYSYEVCDAVEQISYMINGTEVSDFVFPSWFSSGGTAPFDYMRKATAPFKIVPGGSYTESLDVSKTPGWKQITARAREVFHTESEDKD